ncbi:hypothetical protein GIB67_023752 [Kingdonia uniflora]|uniref:Glycosyl hydrolase family 32 C-terminal domain-containing protein n=1 Tax=Kingdonia uniflora TaxID=39325 RepID=A0A7J7LGB7_9MAGN|nr:hypothetical protein GIB67_023752 [Kingdonia uniflora]
MDFFHWVKSQHPLHSIKDTGMRECPDFFPISIISKLGLDTSKISPSVKHELKVSLDDTKREFYTIASQADVEVIFDLPKLEKAEIFDPSWVNLELLCSKKEASKRGSVRPFGLLVLASKGLEEQTTVFFRIFKDQKSNGYVVLMCSDHSRSSLVEQDLDITTYGAFLNVNPTHDKLSLRTLIDHSIVESFGEEGKTCITSRVYPKLAIEDRAQLHVFNNGTESIRITSLSAWILKDSKIGNGKTASTCPVDDYMRVIRDALNAKRYEMDSVLPVINRMNNARSIDDMLVKDMEYKQAHETMPLKEEIQLISKSSSSSFSFLCS